MKTSYVLLVSVFLGFSFVNTLLRQKDQIELIMIDGDLMQISDQEQLRVQDKIMLKNGLILCNNGSYFNENQKKLQLRNGECLDMEGNKYVNEYQYLDDLIKKNKNLTQIQIREKNKNRKRYILIENNIVEIKNRDEMRVLERVRLQNGTILNPDGSFMTIKRQQFKLKNGEFLSNNGELHNNIFQYRKMMMNSKSYITQSKKVDFEKKT